MAVSPSTIKPPSTTEKSAIGRAMPGITNSAAPRAKNAATSSVPAKSGIINPPAPSRRPVSLQPSTYVAASCPAKQSRK